MRGQRRALLIMIPLSTENASVGRPAMFQLRIFTGSPSVAFREKSSEQGIPFAFTYTRLFRLSCFFFSFYFSFFNSFSY